MPLERGWSLRIRGGAALRRRTVRAAFPRRREPVGARPSPRGSPHAGSLFDHLVGVAAQYAPATVGRRSSNRWRTGGGTPHRCLATVLVVMFMSDADICSRRLPAAAMVDGWEATARRTTAYTGAARRRPRRVWGPTTVSAVTHRLRRHGDGRVLARGRRRGARRRPTVVRAESCVPSRWGSRRRTSSCGTHPTE
jgi:hypothetical protein